MASVIGDEKAGLHEQADNVEKIAARAEAWLPALDEFVEHEREAMGDSDRAIVKQQEEVVVQSRRVLTGCADVLADVARTCRAIANEA